MPLLSKTLIIMPAFNEQATVADVITEVRQVLPDATCLVVNDGSRDATSATAKSAGAIVLDLPFNLGVGGAMRLGFRYAVENGYEYAVQLDSDGQHNPRDVPALLAALTGSDIVIGARFAGTGNYSVRGPRKWAMRVLAFAISRIAHTKLTDVTSGFKAMGPRALEQFSVSYPAEYLGDTIEALVLAAKSGCIVTQVPVAMRERMGGEPSHNPVKAAVYLGRATMALIVALWRAPVVRRQALPS